MITGSPGVGKTTISIALGKKIGFEVISLGDVISKENLEYDGVNKTHIVEPFKIIQELKERELLDKNIIFESHYGEIVPSDNVKMCFVLRLSPDILAKRLQKRNYPEKKILDNINVEMLGTCLYEAVNQFEHVYEINTTDKSVEEIVSIICDLLKGKKRKECLPGSTDFLEIGISVLSKFNGYC